MNLLFRLLWVLIFSKYRKPVSLLGPCRTPFRVALTDLDVLRHMNNGKYFSILDIARMDLMIRSGLHTQLKKANVYPVVVAETMRFRKSLEAFQKFEVETQVVGWDEKAFLLHQEFKVKNQVMASAFVRARFLKKSGGTISPEEILRYADFSEPSPPLAGWLADWNRAQK